ncbi:hypothetical protein CEUSTIGMA_g4616.t1 [Chlamydomonas eustigma]|uniref:Uncharacterized protein n=1 Tax=Chlamydomonas eustigma TaxID=1157962 RepID=A0A250X274_9CHLO|nr:hypothetical protein CEUSTIGMA_g4616.t1 [Chlamydomonas eustigma]|eukprot:GAX77171.1 hypothetical protein CEUSTIGMA_g4616.t1 [Chlamydomonas eustigma]
MVSTRSGRGTITKTIASDSAVRTVEMKPKVNLKAAQTSQGQEEDQKRDSETKIITQASPEKGATPRLVEKEVMLSPRTRVHTSLRPPIDSPTCSPVAVATQILSQVPLPPEEEEVGLIHQGHIEPPPHDHMIAALRPPTTKQQHKATAAVKHHERSSSSFYPRLVTALLLSGLLHVAALIATCNNIHLFTALLPPQALTLVESACQVSQKSSLTMQQHVSHLLSQMHQLHTSNGIANKARARLEHLSVMISPHTQHILNIISQVSDGVKQQAHLLHGSRSSRLQSSWKHLHNPSAVDTRPLHEAHTAPQRSKWELVRSLLQKLVTEEAFTTHQDEWEAVAAQTDASQKALGILLVCRTQTTCDQAMSSFMPTNKDSPDRAASNSVSHIINLTEFRYPHDDDESGDGGSIGAGQLQHLITDILLKHASLTAAPVALLFLTGLETCPPKLLSVMSNVLSESGSLQRDGHAVQARSTILVFPVVLPETEEDGGEGRADRESKDQLLQKLKEHVLKEVVEDQLTVSNGRTVPADDAITYVSPRQYVDDHLDGLLNAFRRRLDIVVTAGQSGSL